MAVYNGILLWEKSGHGNISRQNAVDSMFKLTNDLWDYMELNVKKKILKYSDNDWVFRSGYDANAIRRFWRQRIHNLRIWFYEINSGGHPAPGYIHSWQKNRTVLMMLPEKWKFLSMSGGVVVETRKNWDNTMMDIRGNVVYVYDNYTNGLFIMLTWKMCLSILRILSNPGTVLGILGRTGKNAYPSKIPDSSVYNVYPDLTTERWYRKIFIKI